VFLSGLAPALRDKQAHRRNNRPFAALKFNPEHPAEPKTVRRRTGQVGLRRVMRSRFDRADEAAVDDDCLGRHRTSNKHRATTDLNTRQHHLKHEEQLMGSRQFIAIGTLEDGRRALIAWAGLGRNSRTETFVLYPEWTFGISRSINRIRSDFG